MMGLPPGKAVVFLADLVGAFARVDRAVFLRLVRLTVLYKRRARLCDRIEQALTATVPVVAADKR